MVLTHDCCLDSGDTMKLPVLIATVAMFLPAPAFAGPASDAVRFFYTPPNFAADPVLRDRFIDPARAIFEANDKISSDGEVGCIDFGLAVDAQDYDEGEIARTLDLSEEITGDTAEVTARFQLYPDQEESRREVLWTLARKGGQWKVSDIASLSSDWRLSEFDCQ
jgi:hypothetical protein